MAWINVDDDQITDCTGGDGGFDSAFVETTYEDNLFQYCTNDMLAAYPLKPFSLHTFRQR